jgi:hypothetical protein
LVRLGARDPRGPREPFDHERYVGAHNAARQAVRDQRKSLNLPEAINLITTIFTAWGVTPPDQDMTRALARVYLDRLWLFKHPVQAHREGWRFRSPKDD